jgi:hypothetical protein
MGCFEFLKRFFYYPYEEIISQETETELDAQVVVSNDECFLNTSYEPELELWNYFLKVQQHEFLQATTLEFVLKELEKIQQDQDLDGIREDIGLVMNADIVNVTSTEYETACIDSVESFTVFLCF